MGILDAPGVPRAEVEALRAVLRALAGDVDLVGVYDPTKTYVTNEHVLQNGVVYKALKAVPVSTTPEGNSDETLEQTTLFMSHGSLPASSAYTQRYISQAFRLSAPQTINAIEVQLSGAGAGFTVGIAQDYPLPSTPAGLTYLATGVVPASQSAGAYLSMLTADLELAAATWYNLVHAAGVDEVPPLAPFAYSAAQAGTVGISNILTDLQVATGPSAAFGDLGNHRTKFKGVYATSDAFWRRLTVGPQTQQLVRLMAPNGTPHKVTVSNGAVLSAVPDT